MKNREICYAMNKMIDELAEKFVEKYFDDPELKITTYWLEEDSDELSCTLYINGYYFPLDVIYTALWYDVEKLTLFQRYEQRTEPESKAKVHLKIFHKSL